MLGHFMVLSSTFPSSYCPPPPLVLQLCKFDHGLILCASQYYHYYHDEFIGLMPNQALILGCCSLGKLAIA